MPRRPKLVFRDYLRIIVRYSPMTVAELVIRLDATDQRVRRSVRKAEDLVLWDGRVWYKPGWEAHQGHE